MTTNLFVIANAKQLRTDGSFRILLPFYRTSWGVGVLNSAIFISFHKRVEFGTILEGLRNFGEGGGFEPPNLRYATGNRRFKGSFCDVTSCRGKLRARPSLSVTPAYPGVRLDLLETEFIQPLLCLECVGGSPDGNRVPF